MKNVLGFLNYFLIFLLFLFVLIKSNAIENRKKYFVQKDEIPSLSVK